MRRADTCRGAGNLARSRLLGGFFGHRTGFPNQQKPAKSRLQPGLAAPQRSTSLTMKWLAGIALLAPVALAQPRPYIGYVYPAGGRQGTTFPLSRSNQPVCKTCRSLA